MPWQQDIAIFLHHLNFAELDLGLEIFQKNCHLLQDNYTKESMTIMIVQIGKF